MVTLSPESFTPRPRAQVGNAVSAPGRLAGDTQALVVGNQQAEPYAKAGEQAKPERWVIAGGL